MSLEEARASIAENKYRTTHGLTPRTGYDGKALPEGIDKCKSTGLPKRKAPKRSCLAGCGDSNGDPHIQTVDGLRYDLQAVGEFVAARGKDFELQTRQAPWPGSRQVSLNVAAAIQAGGARLVVTSTGSGLAATVDGARYKPSTSPIDVGKGGTLRAADEGRELELGLSDGSVVGVRSLNGWGPDVNFTPSKQHAGRLTGLFGNFDGDPDNDLRLADGTALPADLPFEKLHKDYADSWRVTQDSSLLSYQSGETTQTFTDRSFPDAAVDLDAIPGADLARQLCREQGVTEPQALDDCTLDLLVTKQASFLTAAADRAPTPDRPQRPTPVPGAEDALHDDSTVSGEITDAGQSMVFNLDLGNAERFYVADWRGTTDKCDQTFTINFVGVSHSNLPCTGGTVTFTVPDNSRNPRLEIAPAGTRTGPFSFTLITAKPHTQPAVAGASTTERIAARGQEDVYELPAGVSTVTLDNTSGCDNGIFAEIHDLADGSLIGSSPLCGNRLGPYRLPDRTHRYAITIRSIDLQTGPYAFTLTTG